jgi:hypothetical protein
MLILKQSQAAYENEVSPWVGKIEGPAHAKAFFYKNGGIISVEKSARHRHVLAGVMHFVLLSNPKLK